MGVDNTTHITYLAIIAVLVIIIVYVSGRAIQARQAMHETEERYGTREGLRVSTPRETPLAEISPGEILREKTYDEFSKHVDALVEREAEAVGVAAAPRDRLHSVIALEVCRAASRGAAANPVDASDTVLALELLAEARESPDANTSAQLVGAAAKDVCRQVDWIRDRRPDFVNPDRVAPRICNAAATSPPAEAAFVIGWIVAGGPEDDLDDIRRAGHHFSEAARIARDLAGDHRGPEPDYAAAYGDEASRQAVTQHLNACRLALEEKEMHTAVWREIFKKVLDGVPGAETVNGRQDQGGEGPSRPDETA